MAALAAPLAYGVVTALGGRSILKDPMAEQAGGATLMEDTSHETKELGIVNLGVGAVATISGVVAITKAKRAPTVKPAVVSQVLVHFGAGVVGQRGLGVQLTF